MYKILQYTGEELTLIQSSFFKKKLDLTRSEEVLASFTMNGKFKAGALFEIADKKWEVKQLSFWKRELGIFKNGYELPFAVFKPKIFSSSVLELPMGQRLYFSGKPFSSNITIANQQGVVLLTMKSQMSLKEKYIVTILKVTPVLEEHPWIVLLPGVISILKKRTS
jgi:hypothetical protein